MRDVTLSGRGTGLTSEQRDRLTELEAKGGLTEYEIGELAALDLCSTDQQERDRIRTLRHAQGGPT